MAERNLPAPELHSLHDIFPSNTPVLGERTRVSVVALLSIYDDAGRRWWVEVRESAVPISSQPDVIDRVVDLSFLASSWTTERDD